MQALRKLAAGPGHVALAEVPVPEIRQWRVTTSSLVHPNDRDWD